MSVHEKKSEKQAAIDYGYHFGRDLLRGEILAIIDTAQKDINDTITNPRNYYAPRVYREARYAQMVDKIKKACEE